MQVRPDPGTVDFFDKRHFNESCLPETIWKRLKSFYILEVRCRLIEKQIAAQMPILSTDLVSCASGGMNGCARAFRATVVGPASLCCGLCPPDDSAIKNVQNQLHPDWTRRRNQANGTCCLE